MEVSKIGLQDQYNKELKSLEKRAKTLTHKDELKKKNINIHNSVLFTPRNPLSNQSKSYFLDMAKKYAQTTEETNTTQDNTKASQQNPLELQQGSYDPLLINDITCRSFFYIPVTQNLDFNVYMGLKNRNMNPNFYLSPYITYLNKYGGQYRAGIKLDQYYTIFGGVQKKVSHNLTLGILASQKNYQFQEYYNAVKLYAQYKENIFLYGKFRQSKILGVEKSDKFQIKGHEFKYFASSQATINETLEKYGQINTQVGIFKHFKDHQIKFRAFQQIQNYTMSTKVELKIKLSDIWKFLIDMQYQSQYYTLFIGFQKLNFNFALPIINFRIESFREIFLSLGITGAVVAGAFKIMNKILKKKQLKQKEENSKEKIDEKQELKRKQELKLIAQRSHKQFETEQKADFGLIIIEAYFGNAKQIEELSKQENKINYLYKNPDLDILDVTVPLRFYVQKSKLEFQGQKPEKIIGFRKIEGKSQVLIKYQRGKNKPKQIMFDSINDIRL